MSLNLLDLDGRTRQYMQKELEYDLARQQLHISPYLSGQGIHDFTDLLRNAIKEGDEETLAEALRDKHRVARTAHRQLPQGGFHIVSVPANAAEMIANDAFNRYYMRALCCRAIDEEMSHLIVYRAKPVHTPRTRSEELVETAVDPTQLHKDLRQHTGEATDLGIPGGPNSGLSVHMP